MGNVEKFLYEQLLEIEKDLESYVLRTNNLDKEYEQLYLTMMFYYNNFKLNETTDKNIVFGSTYDYYDRREEAKLKVNEMNAKLIEMQKTKTSLTKLIVQYSDTYIAIKDRIRKMFGSLDD